MKKIVSVLVILALVCGAVFAVDVSTSMRLGINVLSIQDMTEKVKDDAGNIVGRTVSLFDLNKITTENKDVGADSLTFTAGTQFGGFKINFNPNIFTLGSADVLKKAKDMNLYLQWGQFKLSAGKWGDGVYYAEQAKKDFDDTNMSGQGTLASLYKLGMIDSTYGVAFDNLVGINGKAKLAYYAEYKLAKVLPGDLIFTAALAENTDKDNKNPKDFDAEDKVIFRNAIGFRVAYKQNKVINANLDLRFFEKNVWGFGLYLSPLMVKGLSATVGYTMLMDTNDTAAHNGFGIDARARYAVNNKLSITEQFNFTKRTDSEAVSIWNAFNVLYKFSDAFWGVVNFQFDGDKAKDADMQSVMYITPACVIVAGDGCQLTGGVQVELNKNKNSDKMDLAIPLIMRVKF